MLGCRGAPHPCIHSAIPPIFCVPNSSIFCAKMRVHGYAMLRACDYWG
jgi:hypothetical protein